MDLSTLTLGVSKKLGFAKNVSSWVSWVYYLALLDYYKSMDSFDRIFGMTSTKVD
jgi:hypothetical protein